MTLLEEYRGRITEVLHYIDSNISTDLGVEGLAEKACYSKYHFNRVFKSVTGESVYHYIRRIRLEKAVAYLWNTDLTISEVSTKCGFSTISSFSYNYKQQFGISPQGQRKQNIIYKKNMGPVNIDVAIKRFPATSLAYVKNIGSYDDDTAITNRLLTWAGSRGYINDNGSFIRLGYDSTHVTSKEHFRTDLCIKVDEDVEASDMIRIKKLPVMDVATYKVNVVEDVHIIMKEVDNLYYWILSSGFEAIPDKATMLIYQKGWFPGINRRGTPVEIEICIPVKLK